LNYLALLAPPGARGPHIALTADGKRGGWLNGLNITAGTLLVISFIFGPLLERMSQLH
jgi:hypothetical protein